MQQEFDCLAIDGGNPVRSEPLCWEFPGAQCIGEEELELVARVVRAQSPFRYYGPKALHLVDRFERELSTRTGRRHALGVNSGTAALHIALSALEIGTGDEVLVPGYMWVSCISAIIRVGAIPRLVDIDETFCMDPDDLKAKLGSRSKAILVVDMNGAPGHLEEITDIAQEAGIDVLEDSSQAIGSSLRGRPAGGFGTISTFSFQFTKNITAGEGGAIVCDDTELYRRCCALHDLGYPRDRRGRLDMVDPSYHTWGVGARMSELTAAMLLGQISKLDRNTKSMRKAKSSIRRRLDSLPGVELRRIVDPEGDAGSFLITLYKDGKTCQRIVNALRAEGIAACVSLKDWGLHWYFNNLSLTKKTPLTSDGFPWNHPLNDFALQYTYDRGTLPRCDELCERGGLLPIWPSLTQQDIEDVVVAFHKVCRGTSQIRGMDVGVSASTQTAEPRSQQESRTTVTRHMKVAMVCGEWLPVPPTRGGAIEQTLYETVLAMPSPQFKVISPWDETLQKESYDAQSFLHVDIDAQGEKITRLLGEEKPAVLQDPMTARCFYFLNGVTDMLSNVDPDIIQIHNRPDFVPFLSGQFPEKSIVLFMHNEHTHWIRYMDRVAATVHHIVFVSHYLRTLFLGQFPDWEKKTSVVHNAVDTTKWTPAAVSVADVDAVRNNYSLPVGRTILFVGRTIREKGVHNLIDAMRHVRKRFADARLLVVGSPMFGVVSNNGYLDELKKAASTLNDAVCFAGHLDQRQLPSVCSAADVAVAPSLWNEPFGKVLIESMAMQVPVIASNLGGIPEIVTNEVDGVLLDDPADPQGIADAVIAMLGDNTCRRRMGTRARETVLEKFSSNVRLKSLDAFYRRFEQSVVPVQ